MRTLTVAGTLALLSAACGSDSDRSGSGDPAGDTAPDASLGDAGPDSLEGSAGPMFGDAGTPDGGARSDGAIPGGDAGGTKGDAGRPDAGPGIARPADPGVIHWKSCAGDARECGTMQVPLDYANPGGEMIKLAVMRRRASGSRVGTLLLNPGGPGSSAIDFLGDFADSDTNSPLLDRFDLVAFDPRGVGYSTALDCHSTLQALYAVDPSPDDESEWTAVDMAAATFAQECQTKHAALLPHLGTLDVARDMDQVRAALGEAKVTYLGLSYGTIIGAWYAELFPAFVGAMVLDGAVDLSLTAPDLALQQAKGFETALTRYFDWCKGQPNWCSFAQGGDPAQAFAALAAKVEMQPIPAPESDRPLGPGEFLTGASAPLYSGEEGWKALSPALFKAVQGDGSGLMQFTDNYLQRDADGNYANREEANAAVSCLDRAPVSVADVRAAAARFASEAPLFGVPALTGLLVCSHWPAQGQNRTPPRGRGAAPIVVIGTTGDPATPYAWAQAFATQLESAVLLTAEGEGHTGYGRGNRCIDDLVEAYLFDGAVPTATTCSAPAMTTSALVSRALSHRRVSVTRWEAP